MEAKLSNNHCTFGWEEVQRRRFGMRRDHFHMDIQARIQDFSIGGAGSQNIRSVGGGGSGHVVHGRMSRILRSVWGGE
jgi:hypothetical protein